MTRKIKLKSTIDKKHLQAAFCSSEKLLIESFSFAAHHLHVHIYRVNNVSILLLLYLQQSLFWFFGAILYWWKHQWRSLPMPFLVSGYTVALLGHLLRKNSAVRLWNQRLFDDWSSIVRIRYSLQSIIRSSYHKTSYMTPTSTSYIFSSQTPLHTLSLVRGDRIFNLKTT